MQYSLHGNGWLPFHWPQFLGKVSRVWDIRNPAMQRLQLGRGNKQGFVVFSRGSFISLPSPFRDHCTCPLTCRDRSHGSLRKTAFFVRSVAPIQWAIQSAANCTQLWGDNINSRQQDETCHLVVLICPLHG